MATLKVFHPVLPSTIISEGSAGTEQYEMSTFVEAISLALNIFSMGEWEKPVR